MNRGLLLMCLFVAVFSQVRYCGLTFSEHSKIVFTKEKAMPKLMYSYASYCPHQDIFAWFVSDEELDCYWCVRQNAPSLNVTFSFSGVSADGNVVFAFRGTKLFNALNYIEDTSFLHKVVTPTIVHRVDFRRDRFMMPYQEPKFMEASWMPTSIQAAVISAGKRLSAMYPRAPFVVTGHSLGEAIATLAAADLALERTVKNPVQLWTFGSPRVGNPTFSQYLDKMYLDESIRVTHNRDPVPRLPPQFLNLQHIDTEYWFTSPDSFKKCKTEDPSCNAGVIIINLLDHGHYLGEDYLPSVLYGETCFQLLGKVFITAADRISGATMSEKELDGGAKNMPEVSGQNAPQQKEVGSLMNHHQKQHPEGVSKTELAKNWGGNNKAHCSYRLIHGPDRAQFYAVNAMIIIPFVVYEVTNLSKFACDKDTDMYWRVNPVSFIVGIPFFFFTLGFFWIAAYSDPGVVPRNPQWKEININEEREEQVREDKELLRKTKKMLVIDMIEYPVKFCESVIAASRVLTITAPADILRIGNCVGKMNYRYFLAFVLTVNCLLLIVFSFSVVEFAILMADRTKGVDRSVVWDFTANSAGVSREVISGVLAIYSFLMILSVGSLLGYHAWLISTGTKTYERIRERYDEVQNPFDRGFCKNWYLACCSPYYASYIRAKAKRQLHYGALSV
ncbi:hypothetical protein PROFUN_15578 [Planoprotostelium fungivorum]|uniref:Palmitoyltransferase n=1 Tax=Planoprotostelium fungivorum TaxID=1890364 RepID=A0A2P6MRK1_9EUKA|nr:hypothetical protein PROFUN_15578 [Planoprotostelium fungivorum]